MASIKEVFVIRESSGFRLQLSRAESVALRDVEEWAEYQGPPELRSTWKRVVQSTVKSRGEHPDDPYNDDADGENYDQWVTPEHAEVLLRSIELVRASDDMDLDWTRPHLDAVAAKIHDAMDKGER